LFYLAQIILQKEQSLKLSRDVNSLLQEFLRRMGSSLSDDLPDDLRPIIVQAKHDLIKSQFKLARDLQEVRLFDVDEIKTLFESVVTGCTASDSLHQPHLMLAHKYLADNINNRPNSTVRTVSEVLSLLKHRDGLEISSDFAMHLEASVFLGNYYFDKARQPSPDVLTYRQFPNLFEAMYENMALAEKHGNNNARAELSMMLQQGRRGVPRDQQRAFSLAEAGAKLGCCHCQGALACCYYFGFGVGKNFKEAKQLAKSSRFHGSPLGDFAYMLLEVNYVNWKNFSSFSESPRFSALREDQKMYILSAMFGNGYAFWAVDVMYENGRGIELDDKKAVQIWMDSLRPRD
jgi:hypothetical protein